MIIILLYIHKSTVTSSFIHNALLTGNDPVSVNIVSKPVSYYRAIMICNKHFVSVLQLCYNQLHSTPVAIVGTDRAQSLYR